MSTIHIKAHVAPKTEEVELVTRYGTVVMAGDKESVSRLLLDMSVVYGDAYFANKEQGYNATADWVWETRKVFSDARKKLEAC